MRLRTLSVSLVSVVLIAGATACSPQSRSPVPRGNPAVRISEFKKALASVLPEGWEITQAKESSDAGKEGIYLFAANMSSTIDGPKGQKHPTVHLYFRPETATSECVQIRMKGSILSRFLGTGGGYRVYGGSIGTPLDESIQETFGLTLEPQNKQNAAN